MRRQLVPAALLLAILLASRCASAPPPFVLANAAAPVARSVPASAPGEWLLAFIDIETTGLVPGWHEAIDAGFVLTDLEGNEVDALFVRIQPAHPERTDEGARRVNAFDAQRWRELGALPAPAAAALIESWLREAAGGRNVMLVAFNSWFDTAFLDHLFRDAGRSWRELFHYFVLDVPSMAWAQGHRELTNGALARKLGVEDEPRVAAEHTGLTGARLNVRIYRALGRVKG